MREVKEREVREREVCVRERGVRERDGVGEGVGEGEDASGQHAMIRAV